MTRALYLYCRLSLSRRECVSAINSLKITLHDPGCVLDIMFTWRQLRHVMWCRFSLERRLCPAARGLSSVLYWNANPRRQSLSDGDLFYPCAHAGIPPPAAPLERRIAKKAFLCTGAGQAWRDRTTSNPTVIWVLARCTRFDPWLVGRKRRTNRNHPRAATVCAVCEKPAGMSCEMVSLW